MRLIDAEALENDIAQHWGEFYPKDGAVIERIHRAPTIEAKPVNHGKWVRLTRGWYCSSCRELVFPKTMERGTDYCPYCGAKMDEVEK